MLRQSLIVFLALFSIASAFAQKFLNVKTYNVDSLLKILPGQASEARVNTLSALAVSLSFVNYQQSKQYANEALTLANDLEYEEGTANAHRALGNIFFYQGEYPQALNNFNEALTIYEKLGKFHKAGWACYDIARTHYSARNYEKTIEYGQQALQKFRERMNDGSTAGNVTDTIRMYEGLALTYGTGQMGILDKSIDYYRKSVEIGRKNDFDPTELMIMIYRLSAELFAYGKADSAIHCFHEALSYPELNSGIRTLKYRVKNWMGLCYIKLGEYEKGLSLLQEAYDYNNRYGYLFLSVYLANDLGIFYMKVNDLTTAEQYFRQGESKFNEILERDSWYSHDSLKYIANFGLDYFFPMPLKLLKEMQWAKAKTMYYNLFLISEKKNLTDEALKYHIAYTRAGDTLNVLQRNRDIIELQTKYETERKEVQIKTLSQTNTLQELRLRQSRGFLLGLGGLVIIVALFAALLVRQNKLRNEQQNLLLQQKLSRSQMNPHFIFNSLTSIQNFILEQEPDKASKYLSRFSKLVRKILDSSVEEYVTMQEEICTIENYLELQKIRFPDKFDYSIEVDKKINPENITIPPMLAQPFIENSIEHGIKHKKEKGSVLIRFTLKDGSIVFEVEDNGVGREKAQEILYQQNKEHKSLATAITLERIGVINKKLKQKIILHISDLKDSANKPLGTRVQIEIPLLE